MRSPKLRAALAALAPLALRAQEAAGKAAEPAGDPWLAWKWVNFALLAAGLGYLIAKSAGSFFRSRTEEIRKGIDEAARLKREAEAQAAAVAAQVAGLDKEIARLGAEARAEFAAEGQRIESETAQALDRIRAQSEQEIESLGKAAALELKAYAASLAVDLAKARLNAEMNPARDAALISAFAGRLGRDGAPGDRAE